MSIRGILMVGLALACTTSWSAGKSAAAEAQAQYQRERAVCMSGRSNQDRATCLKEAGAAYAEARRTKLGAGETPSAANAQERCDQLAGANRDACTARMQGQGTATGSAASGGILRELEQTVPAAPAK